jgi:hypothetical protein
MSTSPTPNVNAPEGWAADIIEAGRKSAIAPSRIAEAKIAHAKPFVILDTWESDGRRSETVEYLDATFQQPHHAAGRFAFDDVDSLLAYWKLYSTPPSLMYASMEPAQFVGVLNEHMGSGEPKDPAASAEQGQAIPDPDWRDHRCELVLRHSNEWTEWTAHNGADQAFDNPVQFAQWLEDMLPDVVKPAPATLQQVLLTMKLNEQVLWKQVATLANGQVQFVYDNIVEGSATTDAGVVKIPSEFQLHLPVFFGLDAPKYLLNARLRYRRAGPVIRVWYELERPNKVVEQAFRDLYNRVREKCGGVLMGKP